MATNKLIIIGNGFDLAHGLKTSYKDFLDWYFIDSFQQFLENNNYVDKLISISKTSHSELSKPQLDLKCYEDIMGVIGRSRIVNLTYNSHFFHELIKKFLTGKWIDIECFYYENLKSIFLNTYPGFDKKANLSKLNSQFDFFSAKLGQYMQKVNAKIDSVAKLSINETYASNFSFSKEIFSDIMILNFNYTDTVVSKNYAPYSDNVIYIHGKASDLENFPIVFGYGDETDKLYQQIEDSGDNDYLTHIKSFAYFSNNSYSKLISYIDSKPYDIFILGHSCGLSDRVLLSELFENANCNSITVFYHQKNNGSDNFKEITQEISRHFKPENKNLMRRRLKAKNTINIIPQNT